MIINKTKVIFMKIYDRREEHENFGGEGEKVKKIMIRGEPVTQIIGFETGTK